MPEPVIEALREHAARLDAASTQVRLDVLSAPELHPGAAPDEQNESQGLDELVETSGANGSEPPVLADSYAGSVKSRPSWARRVIAAGVAAAAAVVVIVLVMSLAGDDRRQESGVVTGQPERSESSDSDISPSLDAVVDPRVTDVIETGGRVTGPMAATRNAVWLPDSNGETVSRIDAVTREVTDVVPIGGSPFELIATTDAIWVSSDDGFVSRIDLASREVTARIRVGHNHAWALMAEGAIWAQSDARGLLRIDLAPPHTTDEYPLPEGYGAWWAVAVDGAIWGFSPAFPTPLISRFDMTEGEFTDVVDLPLPTGATSGWHSEECCIALEDAIWLVNPDGPLVRFDLVTLQVTDELNVGGGPTEGIVAEGAIWLTNWRDSILYRIDPDSREVTDMIPVGRNPWSPIFADGAIWVPNRRDDTVSRIDADTRKVTHTIEVGNEPTRLLAFDGAIWVPNVLDGTVTRIQTR